jgi:LCP family protein required for cell wall assembly
MRKKREKQYTHTDRVSVDLASTGKKRHPFRNLSIFIGLSVFLASSAFGVYAYQFTSHNIIVKNEEERTNVITQVRRVYNPELEPVQGENEDRINVLLLGKGGEGHQGGDLVDTIMIASLQPSTGQVALISLPRDLVVPIEGEYGVSYQRINTIVFNGGVEYAKEKVGEITGLDMHYYAMVDFTGFRDIIDTLGGIEVFVENSFTDYSYPDYNYGYMTVSFEEGWREFTGEFALQYARSRKGDNGEASDFARARRQQIVIEATRDKVMSASTFLNPTRLSGLLNDLQGHVELDMEIWEIIKLARMVENLDRDNIINGVVDYETTGLIEGYTDPYSGASLLRPRAGEGNYNEIQSFAQGIFAENALDVAQSSPADEEAIVALQNGSGIEGLGFTTTEQLSGEDITVDTVGNAFVQNITRTVIYDFSTEANPATRERLEEIFDIPVVRATVPRDPNALVRLSTDVNTEVINTVDIPEEIDFIILLGSDADNLEIPAAKDDTQESE